MAIHSIELFAGVGMLGEGARAAFDLHGIGHRTVCYVEREAAAASQLVALMEAGAIDQAPIWSDVATFDGSKWRGIVDVIVAGFPCQDISVAGRRAGLDGNRSGLFFHILDIAEDCGAWGIILENVSAISSAKAAAVDEDGNLIEERAVACVLGEMAERGWNAEWLTLRASDVGANHQRNRWFCFAWKVADTGCRDVGTNQHFSGACAITPEYRASGQVVGDTGLQCQQSQQWQVRAESARTNAALADPCEPRLPHTEQSGKPRDPQAFWRRATAEFCGTQLFAPGPSDPLWCDIVSAGSVDTRQRVVTDEEAGTCPWAPATQPGIRMLADGMALVVDESRSHQLRQVGNGVVPLQAAAAIAELLCRAFGKKG